MRISGLLITITLLLAALSAGCTRRPVAQSAFMLPPVCEVLAPPSRIADTLTVALLDPIEPEMAPWARNASERLLFRHLYETLLVVDCQEEVRGGLAGSWKRRAGGRHWTFEIRDEARFWDGTPVTAQDIVWSWRHLAVDPATVSAVLDSAAASSDRVLQVFFCHAHRRVPRELSGPAFAVAKPSATLPWLLGSGPYRIVTSERGRVGSRRDAVTVRPAFDRQGPVIRFFETSAADARDALKRDIDVMVTAEPAVIEYAATRSELVTVALPYDRTYVLLAPCRVDEFATGRRLTPLSWHVREELARDAVRADARGYQPPGWWEDLETCDGWRVSSIDDSHGHSPGIAQVSSAPSRIVYDEEDAVARDLAERIVALAASDPTVSRGAAAVVAAIPALGRRVDDAVAEGVSEARLASKLRDGDDLAYIIAIPRRPSDPCHERRVLVQRAPWLAVEGGDFSKVPIALVDARPHVIVRRDRVGLMVDWYGSVAIVREILKGDGVQ